MPADPLLEIRADGGGRIGFGHVGRCLALAHTLPNRTVFRVDDPGVARFVEGQGGRLARNEVDAPVVLLDQLAPTPRETVCALQAAGHRVALLDDFGDGRADADLVIDPPTGTGWPLAGGVRLAGFEHVLLRGDVLATTRAENSGGVLLVMGGSDPGGLTVPLSRVLAEAGVPVSVALGPGYSGEPPPPAVVHVGADGFLRALASARVLVSAYGHTLLEAAFLGVPAVAVVLRQEQVRHARAFAESGTAVVLDASAGASAGEVVGAVGSLLDDSERYRAMAARGPALVDGKGAWRIAMAIESLA